MLGDAHERALKAAETDATKRALVTFGGRFGLMLYDKEHRARAELGSASQHPDRRATMVGARAEQGRVAVQSNAEERHESSHPLRGDEQLDDGESGEPESPAGTCSTPPAGQV